ncbi:hypothetical protein [Hafnia alvei]|uniref:hypothetical protein n=1 Tax=Hafnia alvei TaxID=569 RepID=UPI00061D2DB4|nr:hypothetical protein [Hafnia alvei]KKF38403.1 hypothetical protein PU01_23775 [Hafnia alvei]MBW3477292.1 hypothetical protein [Hafnia alvei]
MYKINKTNNFKVNNNQVFITETVINSSIKESYQDLLQEIAELKMQLAIKDAYIESRADLVLSEKDAVRIANESFANLIK